MIDERYGRELLMTRADAILTRADAIFDIANHYGLKNQLMKTVEECAELIQAICKGKGSDILEEVADVQIMLHQLAYLLELDNLPAVMDRKLERQLKRIREEEDEVSGRS